MNEVTRQEIYQQLRHASELDEGEEQISLIESAVRLADLQGDLTTQYFAREQLVRACIFGGPLDKALVAFSWCLAQFDKYPGRFSEWAILWKYKWIVSQIYNLPEVPKSRIYAMLDDLSERSLKAGYGLRAVYNHRYRTEKFWDNREGAIEYFQRMQEQPIDGLNNCPACELDDRVSFTLYCGNDESAIDIAAPILNGAQKCGSVPHRTFARILLPLIRLGRLDEARKYHRLGYELLAGHQSYRDKLADHLVFLALTENFTKAVKVFEKHYPRLERNRDACDHFLFSRAAWLLFSMLVDQQLPWLEVKLPRSFSLYSEDDRNDAAELAAWFKQKAEEIGKRFDQRNESDYFARTLAETAALKQLRVSLPLDDAAPPGKDGNNQRAVEGSDPLMPGSESRVPPAAWFDYIADVYYEKAAFPVADGKVELLGVNWQYELLFYVEQVPLRTNVVSLGDIVEMEWQDGDIIPRFKRVVEKSGQRTVRVDLATSDRKQYFRDFLAALKYVHPNYRHEDKLVTFAIEDQELDEETREWLAYVHGSWVYTDTLSQI